MKTLYRLSTGLGEYYVVADHPTEATDKLKKVLDGADYGLSTKREVTQITPIAKEVDPQWPADKFLIP